ncbi:DUF1992 domain-containing protein [Pseudonocardiaceae bacterium YIM PH 21723]|nr:DUF1992 domain-containing protein [Pseudonocardiaceae bacterium YIM PH 21723]
MGKGEHMTQRKPAGMKFGSWVDQQIEQAHRDGEFDDLPGAGKPLRDAGQPVQEDWWLREYLTREQLDGIHLLPPGLQLRKESADLPAKAAKLHTEQAVRDLVDELNKRIRDYTLVPTGPSMYVPPVDVEEILAGWTAQRAGRFAEARPQPEPVRPTRWWQRRKQ